MALHRSLIKPLRFIADNPWVNLLAGGILIYTAVHEIVESTEDAGIGAHHGVLAFGIVHALSALPEILHGFDEVLKASDEHAGDSEGASE